MSSPGQYGPARHAQTYLNKVLRDHNLGCQVHCADITLSEYLDRWLETAAKPRLREKSYRSYESLLRRYVRPSLGPRNLAAICPLDIQAVYQHLVERGLSPRTIRYTHSVLRSSMRQAIRWRLLAEDPTNGAQLPRQRRRELRVLTAEQSRLFLEAAMQTAYGPVFAVALTTAARPSEYLALKWKDIDWERGTVSIARTLERVSGGWRFAETKRARSRRVIKLQAWVLELLTGLLSKTSSKPECSSWDGGAELIFKTSGGRPIDSDKLATTCKSILKKAGLPLMRLYDLRHSGATLALVAGVPPKVVSEQMGHASAAFTLDIYSHVLPHMQEEAAAKVEAVLTKRSITRRVHRTGIRMW